MAYDLQANKITLPSVTRIKDAVIEIVSKHNENIDAVQADLNDLQKQVFGILGYNVALTEDATSGDSSLNIDIPEYVTVGAKFYIVEGGTEYKVTGKDGNVITIDPALDVDAAKDTVLHIKSKIDPEELVNLFNEIEAILNKDGSANDVFDALIMLAQAYNNERKIVETWEVDFDANGSLDVDLSDYNFESADDYNIMISHNEVKPVIFRVAKKDEKTATILATDLRYFAEDEVAYDGSADGADTKVTLLVAFNRNPLSFTLKDLEGNERSV